MSSSVTIGVCCEGKLIASLYGSFPTLWSTDLITTITGECEEAVFVDALPTMRRHPMPGRHATRFEALEPIYQLQFVVLATWSRLGVSTTGCGTEGRWRHPLARLNANGQ